MDNLWYVSRPTEIFIDTDNYQRSINHTCARLSGAIKSGRLNVKDVEFHPSANQNHLHTIVTLHSEMSPIERYTWALVLHSDIYRCAATIMRECHGVNAPDILITPSAFKRQPDAYCQCSEKHKAQVMAICPAAIQLRGEDRIRGFFGLPDNTGWTLQQISDYVKTLPENLFK